MASSGNHWKPKFDGMNKHLGVWQDPALWWAAGGIAVTGLLDVGVSFYLAFRLALTAQNVAGVDRRRIYQAMGRRLWRDPWSFVLPVRERPPATQAPADPHKPGQTG